MNKKGISIGRLIRPLLITILLICLFVKTPNGKIVLIPFLVCSFASLGKSVATIVEKPDYSKIFDKIFIGSFSVFWFGILIYWCYVSIKRNDYVLPLFSIPFWIVGIAIVKKSFFTTKKDSKSSKRKVKFNFRIIGGSILVLIIFLMGVLLLFFGIKDTYVFNQETKHYIATNGYYLDYEVSDSDQDGTLYKLTYRYEVDGQEYLITTDSGTNYIPPQNSIREVRYNPDNPEKAVLVGTNRNNIFIFMGVFFLLGSLTFVLGALTVLGYFDRFKIDVIGTYIGAELVIVGIGILLFQNGTTISLLETVKSFGVWILIPLMFIAVGILLLVRSLFSKKRRKSTARNKPNNKN